MRVKDRLAIVTATSMVGLLFPAAVAIGIAGSASPESTWRVSVASNGAQADSISGQPTMSADGRFVAFHSYAGNLVADDTNGPGGAINDAGDVFVHDRQTGATTRVSVASDGAQANSSSFFPSISADGRFVAFDSVATNLVADDTNDASDVFVHDRETGATTRVSVASDGTQFDGSPFVSGGDSSFFPSISGDGRFVAFGSNVGGRSEVTNDVCDVFVHDRQTGTTTLVSVASDGTQGNSCSNSPPTISAVGRFVAFASTATNLVAGDTNDTWDVFVHDRQTGVTTRVSVASNGTQSNGESNLLSLHPTISADGRFVAFDSTATNLVAGDTNNGDTNNLVAVDIFVHDRQTGVTTRVNVASDGTQSNGESGSPTISADGRFVAFESDAINFVAGDRNDSTDVFVHDRQTGATTLVSVALDCTQATPFAHNSDLLSISTDGTIVAFASGAANLVAGDTNSWTDVFVHELAGGTPTGECHARPVTLSLGKHLIASGTVSDVDGFMPCADRVVVKIQRAKGSAWTTVKSVRTGAASEEARSTYKATIPDQPGTYRAKVKKLTLDSGSICAGDTSGKRRHQH